MIDERLILAIGRLERAVARAETLAGRATANPAIGRHHQALRAEVSAAIARIDRLVEPGAVA